MATSKRSRASLVKDQAAMELFTMVCNHGGTMDLGKAFSYLSSQSQAEIKRLKGATAFIKRHFSKILKVYKDADTSRDFVEAIMPLSFCPDASKGACTQGINCTKLHLCPYNIKGSCSFKEKCRLSHNVRDDHTTSLLMAIGLEKVSDATWGTLLRKVLSDTEMERGAANHDVPKICKFYNNEGGCTKKEKCPFLHVCKHFVVDECKFGSDCMRLHSLTGDQHNQDVLKKFNLRNKSMKEILMLLRSHEAQAIPGNIPQTDGCVIRPASKHQLGKPSSQSHGSKGRGNESKGFPGNPPQADGFTYHGPNSQHQSGKSPGGSSQASPSSPGNDKTEICGFYLKGKCNYNDKCLYLHRELPYQWQYFENGNWVDFTDDLNIKVEQSYCNCEATCTLGSLVIGGHSWEIDFDKLVASKERNYPFLALLFPNSILKLRRVSTPSSVIAPPGHLLSTHWFWYWKDEHNAWQSYDNPSNGVETNTTSSHLLEKDFLNGKDTHNFNAGQHSYILDLKKMSQKNIKYFTERPVIRRPEFVAKDKKSEIIQRRIEALKESSRTRRTSSSSSLSHDDILPAHWSPMDSNGDFILERLPVDKQEYKDAEQRFLSTMTEPKTIIRIDRIQNPDLWTAYMQKKARMTKVSGQAPEERAQLFHGTTADVRDAICQQGFDWRMCGKHGTVYGKGSYFACQASYSHNYTDRQSGSVCYMFIARVLVGLSAVGERSYVRPPPKDPSRPHGELYDSCVNDISNPSIFVIFENSQTYPEYIISYMA